MESRSLDTACKTRPLDVFRRLLQQVDDDPRWEGELEDLGAAYHRLEVVYSVAAQRARRMHATGKS